MQSRIRDKLIAAFGPASLDVIDESERHRGHGGWRKEGETHFRVIMTASGFREMSRLSRQRAVNRILANELETTVHALAMELKAPGE